MTPAGIRLVRSPDGARADVRIDRPPANVLDVAALGELTRAVRGAGDARVLVLSGLPTAFSAGRGHRRARARAGGDPSDVGGDARAPRAPSSRRRRSRSRRSPERAWAGEPRSSRPATWPLCADDARIGFPEVRLACFPPGAVALLPLLDRRRARRGLDPLGPHAVRTRGGDGGVRVPLGRGRAAGGRGRSAGGPSRGARAGRPLGARAICCAPAGARRWRRACRRPRRRTAAWRATKIWRRR